MGKLIQIDLNGFAWPNRFQSI